MILRQRFIIFATLIASLIALPTFATEDNTNTANEGRTPNLEEDENLSTTPGEALDAKAIRASIVNGVIDGLENTKRARIDLSWDILPFTQTDEFKQAALRKAREQIGFSSPALPEDDSQAPCGSQGMMTITIANEDLETFKWLDKLTDEEKICLQNALSLEGDNALAKMKSDTTDFREGFLNFWLRTSNRDGDSCGGKQDFTSRPGCGTKYIDMMTVPEYFRMRRDYFIITDLLRTNGIAYSLDLNGIEASLPGDTTLIPYQGKSTYIFYEGIDWKIDIIRKTLDQDFNVSYYRFGARAITRKPIKFIFRSEDNPTASIAISFRDNKIIRGDLYPDSGYTIGEFENIHSDDVKQKLDTIKSKKGSSQLDILFKDIFGVPASQIVSRKLFGGSNNVSVIGGGLIGNDEIQSLVGANLELGKISEDIVPGVLLGLSPRDEDATLFLGPSLRFSIFTLAAGARLFEFDDGVRVRFAGVVSLDLSRVFNGNKSQSIQIKDPNRGGGWFDLTGIVTNDLSKNVALIGYTLQKDNNIDLPDNAIQLSRNSQQCNDQNEPLNCQPSDQPVIDKTVDIPLNFTNLEEMNFLPKGIYSVNSISEDYVVKDCESDLRVQRISSLATEGNPFIQFNWKVVKKENESLPITCN